MKRVVQREEGQAEYTSVCVPSVKHNDEVAGYFYAFLSGVTKNERRRKKAQ